MEEYSVSKGFLAEIMQCSDNIPELEELLAKNRLLTAKEAFDTAHRNVEEERAEVEQAAKLLNEAYAKALQVENRLNSINLPELLGHKIQLYKMEAEKHHNEQVEMVKKREEVLANMENRDIVQQFRHLQIATEEAKEELAAAEKKFGEFLYLKNEKMNWHKIRFNQNLVSVLMARKQILDIQEPMTFESTSSSLPPAFESDSMSSPNENMSRLVAEPTILKRSILKRSRSDKKDSNEPVGGIVQSSSSFNIASKRVQFAIPLEQVRIIPNREDEPWREGYFQKYKSKRHSLRRFLFSSEEEQQEAVKKFCQLRVEAAEKSLYQSHLARRSAEDACTSQEVPQKRFKLSLPVLNGRATTSDPGDPSDQQAEKENDSTDIKTRSILIRQREDDDVSSSGMPAKRVRFASYVQPENLTFAKIAKRGDSDEESSSEGSDQESSDEDNDSILVPKKSEEHQTAEEDQLTSSEEDDNSEEESSESDDSDEDDSIVVAKKSEKDKAGEEDVCQPDSSKEVEEKKSDEEEEDEDSEEDSEDEKPESKSYSLESESSTSDSEEDKNENSLDTEHLEQKSPEQESSSEESEESGDEDEPGKPESLPESSEEIQETPEEPIPMEVCDNVEEVVIPESTEEIGDKMETLETEEKKKDEEFTLDMAPIQPIVTNVEIIETAPPNNDTESTIPTAGKSPFELEGDDIPSTSTGRTHSTDSPFDMDDFMFPMAQAVPHELSISDSSQSSFLNFSSSDFAFNDDFFFNDDTDNGQYVSINYDL
ncbi:protein starmaker isoform X2 [Drosophila ananassae]|uniref:protein starmaker isoform X2 n=1 Tax=Drosophila ananassae TaxID=7217 RepID=UPI0013A5DDA2|nr:protein starmaker isoform X2 [Drosophila ananassae]